MFFTNCRKITLHIFNQYILSLTLFASMLSIFVFTPEFVGWVSYIVLDISEPNGLVQKAILDWWVLLYFGAFVCIIILNEFRGYISAASCEYVPGGKNTDSRIEHAHQVLTQICEKAGIAVPRLIISEAGAHAKRSIFFGRMIGLNYETLRLNDDELEAVLAHEVGHLVNWDILPLIISVSMNAALVGHRKLVALFSIGVLFWVWVFTDMPFWVNFWFVALTAISLWLSIVVFSLYNHAYSRTREYLADAAAVRYIGWDKRHNLISALHRLSGGIELPLKWMQILMSHPTNAKRAQALKL